METSTRKAYPRALPHRSPEEMAAQANQMRASMLELALQTARQRRWLYGLAAALVVVLALGATTTVYLVNTAGAAGGPAAAKAPEETASKDDAAPRSETKEAKPTAVALAKETAVPPSAAKAKAAGESMDSASKEVFLETLGGLSATNLYQSYLNIGLLADGVENKAITVEAATKTLKIVTSCLSLVHCKLAKLDKATLDPEDHDSLEQIKAVIELLRLQTQTLLAYWATGTTEQSEDYEKARKATWTGLSRILGIDATP